MLGRRAHGEASMHSRARAHQNLHFRGSRWKPPLTWGTYKGRRQYVYRMIYVKTAAPELENLDIQRELERLADFGGVKAGTPVVRCSPREDKDLGTTKHRGSRIETNLRETMHLAKQMMSVPDDLFDQDPGINCMLLMTFRRLLPDCFCSQGNDRSGRVLQSKKEMPKIPLIRERFAMHHASVHFNHASGLFNNRPFLKEKLTSSASSRARVADAMASSVA